MRDRVRSNDLPLDSQLAPEEEQKLCAEQLKLLCSNIPASSIATLVCSSTLIFILWKVISPAVLIPWLGCLFLATFLRYLLVIRYKRGPAEPRESARWGGRLIAGIAGVGLVWGLAGIFLFAEESLVHQVFLVFMLGGMIAGSLGSYSVVRWAFPAFAIPASLPVIIHSIIQGGKVEITMGALALLFVVIMMVVSRRMHAAIVKSLRLQFENIGLITDLTAAKETAEKTSEKLRVEIAERERSQEKIRERAKELSVLNRVIVAAGEAEDLFTLLKNVLDSTLELLDFDGGGIYLVDEDEREAELRCSKGLNPKFLEEVRRVKIDEDPYATVFIRKQAIIADNYQKISPGYSEISGLLSAASIPIFSKDRVIGALNVASKKRYSFSPEEKEILKTIGREAGTALARMRAEEAVRESEGRFRAVFETARDCIFIKNHRLKYVQVNPAIEKLFELPASKIIGLTDDELFGPEAGEHIKEMDLRVLKGEIVEEEHTKPVRGVATVFHIIKVPMRNISGEIIGLCGIARDITERKEWQERITYLSQMAEQMGEMVIVTDLNHVITYANSAVEDILGYRPGEIIGQDSREFFKDVPGNPPDLPRWIQAQKVSGTWRGDIFNRKKDGSIIKVHLSVSLLKDGTGRLLGYVGVSLDITERERLESELRHAQKMEAIGTLAGGLAHDFNNLLSGIMGYASLAKMGLPKGSPFIGGMEEIEDLTQRGADLTRSLLTLARRGDYRPEPLKINRIIEEVLEVVKVSMKKDFRLLSRLSPDVHNIIGDAGQLHQVIMNLCINAREAMPGGGILTVKSSNAELDRKFFSAHPTLKRGEYVLVSISDTGIGMDSPTRARIFDPFFTTKAERSGTGLGLAMANGIIEKHGGYIEVESEPGRGSVFTFYLPATEVEIPAEKNRPAGELRGTETILIVDDEKEFRVSAARWLRALGYTVIEAESGEDALKVLDKKKGRIKLIILDMVMEGMGGAAAFDKMRKIVPDLPVIISSGYSFDNNTQRLFQKGARAFLRKPYKPEKLAGAIRKELESNLSS